MQQAPGATVIQIARELFAEVYEGSTSGGTWFVNMGPDTGVFGSIKSLTAEQASRSLTPDGRSIAAHIEHLRWSLATVNRTMQGEPWQPDWSASWSVQTVDEKSWDTLQTDLRREHGQLKETLEGEPDVSNPMMLRGLAALAPHAAHHLGTIRQMVKLLEH